MHFESELQARDETMTMTMGSGAEDVESSGVESSYRATTYQQ
jgi:hypothetical protein